MTPMGSTKKSGGTDLWRRRLSLPPQTRDTDKVGNRTKDSRCFKYKHSIDQVLVHHSAVCLLVRFRAYTLWLMH